MITDLVTKAIVLNGKNDILALRRGKTAPRRALQWDLPGGLVDEGESPYEAVKREIQEETGLIVSEVHLIYSLSEIRENKNVIFLFFVTHTGTDAVQISFEHEEYRWMDLDNAIENFEYKTQKDALTYIKNSELI